MKKPAPQGGTGLSNCVRQDRIERSNPARPIRQDHRPAALTAVLDRHGLVVSVLAGRSAARAFLREGHA